MTERIGKVERTTAETHVEVMLNLDGKGDAEITTGIGFFDHMLTLVAVHGGVDLILKARGDLHVDAHHTLEDVGICFGEAFSSALGNRDNINRYGYACIPMEESLAEVIVDLARRPYLIYTTSSLLTERLGGMESELVEEFLRAFAVNALMTLHAHIRYGSNSHHMIEALFKAFGRSLWDATRLSTIYHGPPSSKGIL